jgi:hypothetical protein
MRLLKVICLTVAIVATAATAGCAATSSVPNAPALANCTGSDTTKVPINDLGAGCYLSYHGGLYPGGTNELSGAHRGAGVAAAAQIAPLDANGAPSANGKYVLVSIGMSNTTQEFCNDVNGPGSCQSGTFMAQAAADAAVNHTTLAIVNGAAGGRAASSWVSASSVEYDRIRDTWLTPQGLSEKQVQIAWVKVANPGPTASLPKANADAFVLENEIGQIARALKTRYPNLRQVFLTSRLYAGYATTTLNPEPYAYESGYSVKWAIESQMRQMSGGLPDAQAGSLRYDTGEAPWLAWGPYPWAAGAKPRSDGLTWQASEFAADGTHPGTSARQKVGAMLLSFFRTSPVTSCWFVAGMTCR